MPRAAGSPRGGEAFLIGVTNLGPAPATGVVLTVNLGGLPAGDVASIQAPRACSVSGASITCPLGRLRVTGKAVTTSISVLPSPPAAR